MKYLRGEYAGVIADFQDPKLTVVFGTSGKM